MADIEPKVIEVLVPGPQGAPGAVIRGDYDPVVQYEARDGVSHNGSSYYTLTPTVGVAPPASPWKVLASKGDQGPQGIQGLKGDKGDRGDEGPQGADGLQGVQGVQGLKGDKGDAGDQGLKGDPGDKGDTGDQGLKGDKGDAGDQGLQGIQGLKGDRGDKGDQGDQGVDGPPGPAGPQGVGGPQGLQGLEGPQGVKGDQGIQGVQGAAGDKGDKGDKGDAGATLVIRGPYDNAGNYVANDVVTYGGSAYYLINPLVVSPVTGVVPPTAPWQLFTDVTTAANTALTSANSVLSAANLAVLQSAVSAAAAAFSASKMQTLPGGNEFSLFDSAKNLWLQITPTAFRHAVIDALNTAMTTAQGTISALQTVTTGQKGIAGPAEFALFDANNYRWFKVTPAAIKHVVIDAINAAIATLQGQVTTLLTSVGSIVAKSGPAEFALFDGSNYRWFKVTPTQLKHPAFDAALARISGLESQAGAQGDPTWDSIAMIGEVISLIAYGQSLSRGHSSAGPGGAGTVYSSTASPYALMFNGGVRPDDLSTTPGTIYASLQPAVEAWCASATAGTAGSGSSTNDGETPISGMAQMLAQLLIAENGVDPSVANQKFLISSVGSGGQPSSNLGSSSSRWGRVQEQFSYGKSLCDTAGKSFATGGMLVVQGENEVQNAIDPATWTANWRAIRADAQTYAQSITGGSRPYPLFMYQLACHNAYGRTPDIALAQLALCNDTYVGFATPIYFLPYNTPTDIHLSGLGSKWLGAYNGLLAKRWLIDRKKPAALVPTIRAEGNHIIARFPLDPGRKLAIDTSLVPAQTNWGMTATNAAGVAKTLSNPRLAGRDCIVWDASETPADVWKFNYAWQGNSILGLGNIRDDNPLVFDPTGLKLPMYKWAPIFQVSLTT